MMMIKQQVGTKQLKEGNRLEDVMAEFGVIFQPAERGEILISSSHPGLVLNARTQRYEWSGKGEDGDVFVWLRNRNGWSFLQARNYLEYRAGLGAEERARLLSAVRGGELAIGGEGDDGIARNYDLPADPAARRILLKLADYPGFERLGNGSVLELIRFRNSIPALFMPMVGELDDGYCVFCFNDLLASRNYRGESCFLSVEVGQEYHLTANPETAGIYCSRCVEAFLRWRKAFGSLIDLLASRRVGLGLDVLGRDKVSHEHD